MIRNTIRSLCLLLACLLLFASCAAGADDTPESEAESAAEIVGWEYGDSEEESRAGEEEQVDDPQGFSWTGVTERIEQDFDSPEAAIESYFEALSRLDLDGMLASCAVETFAERFDFLVQTERLQAIALNSTRVPSVNEMFVEMNCYTQLATYNRQIFFFVASVVQSEEYYLDGTVTMSLADLPFTPEEYVESFDLAKLTSVELLDIGVPYLLQDQDTAARFNQSAATYGADEITERIALFSCGGEYYATGFMVVRYGEFWRFINLGTQFAAQPANGEAIPLSGTEEFYGMI